MEALIMGKRTFAFIMALGMFLAGLIVAQPALDGQRIDSFQGKGGPSEDVVTLRGGQGELFDSHMYFEIEKNVPISSASLKVETVSAENGPWLRDPALDIGLDNRIDWSFTGTGYGDLGRNTRYSDDNTMKTNSYSSSGTKTLGDVNVPAEAEVLSATMTVRGRFEATWGSTIQAAKGGAISYTPGEIRVGNLSGSSVNDALISTGSGGDLYLYVQDSEGQFTSSKVSAVSGVYDYQIYDINDDGHNDIVYASSGGVKWVKNDGTGAFSTVTTLTSSFTPYLMGLCDMDKDGDMEIIGARQTFNWGTSQAAIVMLKRSSGSSYNVWPLFDTGSSSGSATISFLRFGDWNNDGYKDVYGAFGDRKVYTFQNPAYKWYYNDTTNITSKTKWTATNVIYYSYSIQGFDVGDVDKDGKADVVIAPGYYYSNIYYFRNMGTSTWTQYSVVNTYYLYYPDSVAFAELSGDGYLDIFFATDYYYYYNRVSWCTGGSSPNKNNWATYDLMTGYSSSVANAFSCDLNSDGYTDVGLFVPSNKQTIVWLNNPPHDGSKLDPAFVEDGGLVSICDLEKYDMDEDGDVDFLITASTSGTVGWYENDGTPFTDNWKFHRINGVLVGGAREASAGDIDGDGDLDVAVTAYDSGRIMWFENNGDPKKIWTYHNVGSQTYPFGCAVGDLNKDGIMEIVVSAGYYYYDGIRIYYSSNPKGSWSYYYVQTNVGYCGAINLTDMNGDSYLDIIVPVNGWSGTVNIYRNPYPKGMTTSWPTIGAVSGLSYPYEALPIDINGDGSLDLVTSANFGDVYWGKAPANKQSTGGWTTYAMGASISYPWGLDVTDVDNDGFVDVFVTSHYWWSSPYYYYGRGVFWLEEKDDPTGTWQKRTLDSNMRETYGVVSTDFDGNNQPEIFATAMYDDDLRYSKPTLNYPSGLTLDLGNDGIIDWSRGPFLRGTQSIDVTDELQYVLDTKPIGVTITTDQYGNRIMKVPMNIYSATMGRMTGYGIDIRYNVTFPIENGGAIRDSIMRLIPDYSDPMDPILKVYLMFMASSAGQVHVFDLNVEYNAPPRYVQQLPKELVVKEDTLKRKIIDLSDYFSDDYDAPRMLHYSVEKLGTNKDKVNVFIEDGSNVTVDSTITKDFDREIQVRFIIKDNGGMSGIPPRELITNTITIDIEPVPDIPMLSNGTLPQKIKALEGMETTVLDLTKYYLFEDPDDPSGTSIRFKAIMDPAGTYPQDLSTVRVDVKDRKLVVSSLTDWYGSNIPIRVYGYNEEFNPTVDPFHTTFLSIENVNDGPSWEDIPSVEIDEDTAVEGLLDLTPYVLDIDTPPSGLEFEILSWTNSTYCRVYLSVSDNSILNYEPRPLVTDWYGRTDVTIQVKDEGYSAVAVMSIIIGPINDLPSIKLNYPYEMQSIEEGLFAIGGDAYDIEGIDRVEVFFEGAWAVADGKNSWGKNLFKEDIDKITSNVPIKVRVIDTDGEMVYAYVNVTFVPKPPKVEFDRDGDGYPNTVDDLPDDPSEHTDTDNDGYGDAHADAFPLDPQWHSDLDGDGIADEADDYPTDPENKDIVPIDRDTQEDDRNWMGVIILCLIAVLLLLIVLVSLYAYTAKAKASRDPHLSVKFYNDMEKRRLFYRKVTGREQIEKMLSKAQLKDLDTSTMGMKRTVSPMMMPQRSGPMLPPSSMQRAPPPQMLPPPRGAYYAPPPPIDTTRRYR